VVLVVFYGLGEALFQPAFTAIVPDVVPREELLQANALKELMEPLGLRFAGPAVGGVLIAAFDVGVAFLVDACTFAVAAVAAALFLFLTFGPFEVLLPYIIRNELGGDADTFGLVLAAGGLGSIMAALTLSRAGIPRRYVTFMWGAWFLGDLLIVVLAVAGAAWQMCLIALVSFGLGTAGMVVWNTMMNTLVPTEMLGRVSSFDWFVSMGLIPLSFAVTGPVAELLGARTTLALSGLLGALTLAFLFVPGARDPEREPLAATAP
jgi:MFS family permease